MRKEQAFCIECRDYRDYEIKEKMMKTKLKDKEYEFLGKEAICKNCGSEIYIAEINDYNLKSLYDEYRKENNIISQESIEELTKLYNIGKRPLSTVLGLGEQTLSRYIAGDVPTKQYSDYLQKVCEDPVYYGEMLEKNKEKISDTAYKKSKKALDILLNDRVNDYSTINLAAQYFVSVIGDITPLALQKSLYYAQGFFAAFNGKFLFKENCEAWAHGPVYRKMYDKYKDYKFNPINPADDFDKNVFTSAELAILESVAKYAACYSGKVLEEITHLEAPWLNARKDKKALEPSDEIIKKEDIKEYFMAVKEKNHMTTPANIKEYFDSMVKQI